MNGNLLPFDSVSTDRDMVLFPCLHVLRYSRLTYPILIGCCCCCCTDIVTDKGDPGFGPSFITVNVSPGSRVMDTKLHSAPVREHLKPTSQMLTSKQGYVVHKFEVDGEANICVRASTASTTNPMRFGLRVKIVDSDPLLLLGKKGEGTDVPTHLGHIEVEMKRIQGGMKSILAEADYSKDRDWLYHQVRTSESLLTCFFLYGVRRSSTTRLFYSPSFSN
jgi:hypothetical protein